MTYTVSGGMLNPILSLTNYSVNIRKQTKNCNNILESPVKILRVFKLQACELNTIILV